MIIKNNFIVFGENMDFNCIITDKEINQKDEMISNYKEGLNLLEAQDYFAASKKFLEAEILFPPTEFSSVKLNCESPEVLVPRET